MFPEDESVLRLKNTCSVFIARSRLPDSRDDAVKGVQKYEGVTQPEKRRAVAFIFLFALSTFLSLIRYTPKKKYV